MTARRRAALAAVLGIGPLALTGLAAGPASAHGTMGGPVSRVLTCYAENPENPASAACRAAVAAGGTQAFYDWNGVRIGDAAGRHRQVIPDGELCSAGNEEFKALDLARADWPATRMTPGRQDLAYRVTARHKGSFELYMTKAGYDPSRPLAWSDLEAQPFAKVTDPQVRDGSYVLPVEVPARSGRQLVYAIWQRSTARRPSTPAPTWSSARTPGRPRGARRTRDLGPGRDRDRDRDLRRGHDRPRAHRLRAGRRADRRRGGPVDGAPPPRAHRRGRLGEPARGAVREGGHVAFRHGPRGDRKQQHRHDLADGGGGRRCLARCVGAAARRPQAPDAGRLTGDVS